MKRKKAKNDAGFSLLELLVAMIVMLVLLGVVSSLLSGSLGIRARESQKADALAAALSALNTLSREIANSGFGIYTGTNSRLANNGIIAADSNANQIHMRSNVNNVGPRTLPTSTIPRQNRSSGTIRTARRKPQSLLTR